MVPILSELNAADTSAHDKMAAVYADEAEFACQGGAKNAASTINPRSTHRQTHIARTLLR